MKKLLPVFCAAVFVFSVTLPAAAQDVKTVKGTVTKIDEQAKSVTIQALDGTTTTVVMEDPALLSRVTVNGKAEAKYVVKNGVNSGAKLRKLIEGCE